jgi:RNA-directed DNA polymerase
MPWSGGRTDADPPEVPERRGLGWKRWSKAWLYNDLGLFNDYRVTCDRRPAVGPSGTAL